MASNPPQPQGPALTAHILNTMSGIPAAGVQVALFKLNESPTPSQQFIATTETNANGRVTSWNVDLSTVESGIYTFRFETGAYFDSLGVTSFYPYVEMAVRINKGQHYHIPLLLAPYGYTTYRGS
ncbi:putative 5-hydroxyisourate hydrolase [Schizosaccharomyces pombe]|uniref:Probable 5-hydroxyisourate hydrolase n=1 Tax=Schizosaccharomyces pombe (strain 972 / ATCC 24843) TaxID=284812 RepID=HIUH_SCHPO|nr:putative transthyretin [Schizosaccharomyces pombe]O74492.1 RecName: Full=Probable 5-hydroxyisourate hydrolase; Short=HIU hydrolase; Short=HIUHase; AltName: Full=Transthyretin-like protein C285.04 [Schizosaccharomyces pombe 972h-]CAA20843.1 transthyretin (predicted) [Schizosaccharomyces pombe]|eukprot:NP_588333.1 putative transthyretin [Schizosaccharomyces pombe]